MNRTSAFLCVLLVGSNVAWLVSREAPVPPDAPERSALREREDMTRVRELESEVAELEGRLRDREEQGRTQAPAAPAAGTRTGPVPPEKPVMSLSGSGELGDGWLADLQQITDPARRSRALAEMEAALVGTDPARRHAALSALCRSRGVDYDRAPYVSSVRLSLEHENPVIRALAASALAGISQDAESLELVRRLLRDESPVVRRSIAGALIHMSGSRPSEQVYGDLSALLADRDSGVVRQTISILQFVRNEVSSGVDARLIAFASGEDRRLARAALSTLGALPMKSEAVTNLLLERLESKEHNARGTGYRGLHRGVPAALHSRVADAALKVMWRVPKHNDVSQCFRLLHAYGDATHLAEAERFAASEMLSDQLKHNVGLMIKRLRDRLNR
jgi:HEAT repeats